MSGKDNRSTYFVYYTMDIRENGSLGANIGVIKVEEVILWLSAEPWSTELNILLSATKLSAFDNLQESCSAVLSLLSEVY